MKIHYSSEVTGSRKNHLPWVCPEQVIGEMEFLGLTPGSPVIEAPEGCVLIKIPFDKFREAITSDIKLLINLAKLLVKKILQEKRRSEVIQMGNADRQVAQTLIIFGEERGFESDGITLKGRITQEAIAGYIGKRRDYLSQENSIFDRLKDLNIVEFPKRGAKKPRVKIIDHDKLKIIARKGLKGLPEYKPSAKRRFNSTVEQVS